MSDWWTRDELRGELRQAVARMDDAAYYSSDVFRCRLLFDALNVLWGAHGRALGDLDQSDSAAVRDLLIDGIPADRRQRLVSDGAIAALATFHPPVLNHDVLRRSAEYRLGHDIPRHLEREASSKHDQLTRAFDRWSDSHTEEQETALLKKLAQLLYVVRSNIAHGEKSFGVRDVQVCQVTNSALDVIVDALFAYPSGRLAVYGVLAPGEPHHSQLAAAPGAWMPGTVRGTLNDVHGLAVLHLPDEDDIRSDAVDIAVEILDSPELPQLLPRLDMFEGDGYRRTLTVVETSLGVVVANVYVGAT